MWPEEKTLEQQLADQRRKPERTKFPTVALVAAARNEKLKRPKQKRKEPRLLGRRKGPLDA